MLLQISLIKSPTGSHNSDTSKTFNAQGGSIGRAANNLWVLQDTERFLSNKHCQITFENNQFYLSDTSTNGTFLNGSMQPIGKGNKAPIKSGDRFALGEYEFQVTQIQENTAGASSSPFDFPESNSSFSSPFGASAGEDIFNSPSQSSGYDPFSHGHVPSSDPFKLVEDEETDPLAALDKANKGGFNPNPGLVDPFAYGTTHSDQASPVNQAVNWPSVSPDKSGGIIPDDWDDDLGTGSASFNTNPPAPSPVKPAPVKPQVATPSVPPAKPQVADDSLLQEAYRKISELEHANKKLTVEVGVLKQLKASAPATASGISSSDRILMNALGLGERNLPDEKIQEISQLTGELMRDMIAGMMKVLSSRSSIKNEFRMSVTTIQPKENNPLKFSVNVDDALENMFLKKGNAYKSPKESVEEGFISIAEHQMAVISGMRAAFKGVIERFDHVQLEKKFEKHNKGSILPGLKNAKNWELYCEHYNELVGNLDNSFQYLFGDDFVSAYEEQLSRLAVMRKAQKGNKQG